MAKAYDRLEWTFIEKTLTTMGFPSNLVHTIMKCVNTDSFSILINGQPSEYFKPQRGIKQGDPLSPYLFILCADVFSGMLTNAQNQSLINGIAITHDAPKISHLFFADDSIIFCKANKAKAPQLKAIFEEYQRISGRKINMDKSEMTFSPLIYNHINEEFQNVLPLTITHTVTLLQNILVCLPRLVSLNKLASILSWTRLKISSKAGRKNSYPLLVEVFLLVQ
jgi:hypothetical protein